MRRRTEGDVGTAALKLAAGGGVVCTSVPLAERTNIVGTSNSPFGYRLGCKTTGQRNKSTINKNDGNNDDFGQLSSDEEKKEMQRFFSKLRSVSRDERRFIAREVRKNVELELEAYDRDLEERRERLRELLAREEAEITRELVEKARKLEEERAAELEARSVEAAKEAEEKRLKFVREKQLQRYAEINEEFRDSRSQALAVDAKRVNKVQIDEAERRRRDEREYESFWDELAEIRIRAEAEELANSAIKRAELERKTAQKLREQMNERQRRNNVNKPLEYGTLGIGANDDAEITRRREKIRQTKEDLDAQLDEARRCLQRGRNDERELAEMTAIFVKNEPGTDRRREDKEARRREIDAFMESMKNFREAASRREAEAEEWLRRFATEADLKEREAARRAREDRARSCRETKLVWDRQLEEKRQLELLELKADKTEDANDETTKEKNEMVKRRQAAREYGRELMAQQEQILERRAREKRELDEAIERQKRERDEDEARMASELRGSRFVCGGVL